MADWILPFLEVAALLMLAWCLADAWRRGPGPVLELAAAAAFGLMAEQMAVALSHGVARPDAYRYGPFGWMATPDVPLAVVLGWGAILYSAMKYSDGLGIPAWLRPFADGLYALMVDLTMDVVAVNLGFWQWAIPPGRQWFGVPFSNYGGWLLVAAFFSTAARLARGAARGPAGAAPGPAPAALRVAAHGVALGVLAAAAAAGALGVAGRLFTGAERDAWPVGLLALMAAGHLLYGLQWRRRATGAQLAAALAAAGPPPPWPDPARALPVAWHATYLLAAALPGLFSGRLDLLFLTGLMAAVGVVLVEGLAPPRAAG